MWPKRAKLTRVHIIPKIYKHYERLPKFKFIIDTASAPYNTLSMFSSHLLNPLTKMIILFQIPFPQPKILEKYLKSCFNMVTGLHFLT